MPSPGSRQHAAEKAPAAWRASARVRTGWLQAAPALLAAGAAVAIRWRGRSHSRSPRCRRCAARWADTPQPDFDEFVDRLLGRWSGWQSPWQDVNSSVLVESEALDKIDVDVSEITKKCMACGQRVDGVTDFGKRDRTCPGFVFFGCGSWMDAPREGVSFGSACLTVALTLGHSEKIGRRIFTVETEDGRIVRARIRSVLGGSAIAASRQNAVQCANLAAPFSLRECSGWTGSVVRARPYSPGGQWHGGRLRWDRCSLAAQDVLFDAAVAASWHNDVTLPFGCGVASCALRTGGLAVALWAAEPKSGTAKLIIWSHAADGTPEELMLYELMRARAGAAAAAE